MPAHALMLPGGLVGIEARLQDGLLSDNYQGLTPETGQLCGDLVVMYLSSIGSVEGKNVDFVKKLTKVAGHVAAPSQMAENLLRKLYQFNLEGAEMVKKDTAIRTIDHLLM